MICALSSYPSKDPSFKSNTRLVKPNLILPKPNLYMNNLLPCIIAQINPCVVLTRTKHAAPTAKPNAMPENMPANSHHILPNKTIPLTLNHNNFMKKLFSKYRLAFVAFVLTNLMFMAGVYGQISITSLPYSPATTNFNSYNPNSSTNLNATIGTGWTASSSGTAAYNGQGTGTSSTGGYWGYGSSSEYSLGAIRSGTPGNITYTVSFINNSGSTINSITLSWDYEQYRYKNNSGWDCTGTGDLAANSTLNAKDFAGASSGTDGNVSVTPVTTFTLTGLSIANGSSFGISWVTTDDGGSDNGVAIDNFSISATCTTLPQGSLAANGPFCATGAGQLTWTATAGTGPYTVIYNDGVANRTASGVVSGTPFNVFTTPVISTTTYTLVSVLGSGCTRSSGFTGGAATITVNALPATPSGIAASPASICNGSSSTISVTAPGAGLTTDWYTVSCGGTPVAGGTGVNSLSVSPITTTIYYARTRNTTTGCVSASCASVTVTVKTLSSPPTGASSSANNFCADAGGTLDLTASGGSTGTGATLKWYSGSCGGTLLGSGSPLTISKPTITTTYYARYEGDCNTTTCASVTVIVNPAVVYGTITSGDESICYNGDPSDITFTPAPSGGAGTFNYQWYYKDGINTCPTGTTVTGWTVIAGATASSYNPPSGLLTSRTYAVTVDPSGSPDCGVATWANSCRKVTVNPLPTPSITGASPVCAGSTSAYSVTNVAGHTYLWSVVGGTPTSGTGNSITVTWGSAGTGTVDVTGSTCRCSTNYAP